MNKLIKFRQIIFILIWTLTILLIGLNFNLIEESYLGYDFVIDYIPEAKIFLSGFFPINYYRGPLYSVILALASLITQDFLHAAILISAVSSGISVWLILKITQRLFNTRVSFLAGLIMITSGVFISSSFSVGTDMVSLAMLLGSFYLLLLTLDKPTASKLAWLGLLGGLAYLVRSSASILILVTTFAILFSSKGSRKARFIHSLFYIVCCLITLFPYGLHTLRYEGSFLTNHLSRTIGYEVFEKERKTIDEYFFDPELPKQYDSFIQVLTKDPGKLIATATGNILPNLQKDILHTLGLGGAVGFICGLAYLLKNRRLGKEGYLYLICAIMFATNLLSFYVNRYGLPVLPLYAILGSVGFWQITKFKSYFGKRIYIILVVALTTNLILGTKYAADIIAEKRVYIALLGQQIKNGLIAPGRIAASHHGQLIVRYLGLEWHKLVHFTNFNEIADSIIPQEDVVYLLVSDAETTTFPFMEFLLDPDKAPPYLSPVYQNAHNRLFIYKIERNHQ